MNLRHLTRTAAAFAAALTLTACGGSNGLSTGTTPASSPASTPATSETHSYGHGGSSSAPAAPAAPAGLANDADISFLTGMKPHHQQAVEMSDTLLATDPPPAVAAVARQIQAAQDPEIEQMDTMLTDLGQPTDAAAHSGAHSTGHGGMMSEADMAALMEAKGDDAARLYLKGMIAHHKGAIEASEAELRDGTYEPARRLATDIATDQATEITKMEGLLASV